MDSNLNDIRSFACKAHAGQFYGTHPYGYHLKQVVEVLKEFGVADERLLAAGWLHDVIEDCGVTRGQILDLTGDHYVALLVWQVTDEPGRNRKERKALTYLKTAANPDAVTVKLADRIANIRESLKNDKRLYEMYRKEQAKFEEALRLPVLDHKKMWEELARLFAKSNLSE